MDPPSLGVCLTPGEDSSTRRHGVAVDAREVTLTLSDSTVPAADHVIFASAYGFTAGCTSSARIAVAEMMT